MMNRCDGFYEIEFHRAYKMQGRILYKLRYLQKQLACYVAKRDELAQYGKQSASLQSRIDLTNSRIEKYQYIHDQIEDYKHEISLNNPQNIDRIRDSQIINAAYERAYASNGR